MRSRSLHADVLAAANPELFAGSLAALPDMDGDGQQELGVGCTHEALSKGSVLILYLTCARTPRRT